MILNVTTNNMTMMRHSQAQLQAEQTCNFVSNLANIAFAISLVSNYICLYRFGFVLGFFFHSCDCFSYCSGLLSFVVWLVCLAGFVFALLHVAHLIVYNQLGFENCAHTYTHTYIHTDLCNQLCVASLLTAIGPLTVHDKNLHVCHHAKISHIKFFHTCSAYRHNRFLPFHISSSSPAFPAIYLGFTTEIFVHKTFC